MRISTTRLNISDHWSLLSVIVIHIKAIRAAEFRFWLIAKFTKDRFLLQ